MWLQFERVILDLPSILGRPRSFREQLQTKLGPQYRDIKQNGRVLGVGGVVTVAAGYLRRLRHSTEDSSASQINVPRSVVPSKGVGLSMTLCVVGRRGWRGTTLCATLVHHVVG